MSAAQPPVLDVDLWHQALLSLLRQPPDQCQSPILGAALGILYGERVISEAELIRHVRGALSGTGQSPDQRCGILKGLLATAREVAWDVADILAALDEQFGEWDEEDFLKSLPDLRLAFAGLTPQEIHRVAGSVASLHGEGDLGQLIHLDLDEAEVQQAVKLNQRVLESLQADGLLQSFQLDPSPMDSN